MPYDRMNLHDWNWLEPALVNDLPMFNYDAGFVDWFARLLGKRDFASHSTSTEHQVALPLPTKVHAPDLVPAVTHFALIVACPSNKIRPSSRWSSVCLSPLSCLRHSEAYDGKLTPPPPTPAQK